MAELVFEIGCEEMPARFLPPALEALARLARRELASARLDHQGLETKGTPRRLALLVHGLAERQPDHQEQYLGPPLKAAFDDQGRPTKAAQGFARSRGVAVEELETIQTDKGPRVGVTVTVPGRPAAEVLAEILPRLVGEIPFPKTMRWGSGQFRFARPIHWLLALLDEEVIPFELAGITSGRTTRGHRFMAPEPIELASAREYEERLQEAHVIVDRAARRELTRREVEQAAASAGGRLVEDPELLEEVTDLVELPVACCGSFDPEFLAVPRPVIISAMRSHQRYFALEDEAGRLLPRFIAVNNTRPRDLAVVTTGHERVLRARLADARFFLEEDTARPLADYLEDLKEVTYHAKLGTSYQKVERFTALARFLAQALKLDQTTRGHIERACRLCKNDLVTEMVGEFPELQGVVGREYALRSGEPEEVAQAIAEHYMPLAADAPLPQGVVGAVVGLADRLDTICGLFGIGERPSGAADPYGLRRAAIAVIRLIVGKGFRLSLSALLQQALEGLKDKLQRPAPEVAREVTEFFAARCQGLLAEEGVPTDVAQAALAVGLDDLVDLFARARALARVKETDRFRPLAIGLKRCMNILRKEADQVPEGPADPEAMVEEAERELYRAFKALEAEAARRIAAGDYLGFLEGISELKGPVDRFFDDVLVMHPEEKLRRNRLALLKEIADLFRQVAEFTHLQLA
jgi:glycyl-tRNA synthetase beta chain